MAKRSERRRTAWPNWTSVRPIARGTAHPRWGSQADAMFMRKPLEHGLLDQMPMPVDDPVTGIDRLVNRVSPRS